MPFQGMPPMMDYDQLIEDQAKAFAQLPPKEQASEQLPAYAEAIRSGARAPSTTKIDVKEKSRDDNGDKKASPSKRSAFKSFLNGGSDPSTSRSPGSSSKSTLMSILTGDVQKHHPMYALERSVDPSARR